MNPNQNDQQLQQPQAPLPVQNQDTQPAAPSSPLSKTLLIIFGVFVILGLIGGGYYLGMKKTNDMNARITKTTKQSIITNHPSPTKQVMPTQTNQATNWQTYTNTALGVTFSYPKDYVTLQETPTQVRLLKGLNYILEVKKLSIPDTVNSWWQKGAQLDANGSQLNTKNYIKSAQTWNDYQAYSFKLNSNNYQVPMDFYAIRVDNANYTSSAIYTISYETDFPIADPTYAQANATFDKTDKPIIAKILGSFRFIDPQ